MPLADSTLDTKLRDVPVRFRPMFLTTCLIRLVRDADLATWENKQYRPHANGRVYSVKVVSRKATKAEMREREEGLAEEAKRKKKEADG